MRTETVVEMLARLRATQLRQASVTLRLTPGQLPPTEGDVLVLTPTSGAPSAAAVRVARVRGRRVQIENVLLRRPPLGAGRWTTVPPARRGGLERLRRERG